MKTTKNPRRLAVGMLIAMMAVGCNMSPTESNSRPLGNTTSPAYPIKIVATVGMVADLVREIGGDRVEVSQICGPGVDPHLYKATRDDVAALSTAEMVFYSGLLLEGKMSDTLVKMARSRPVVAVTESIDETLLLEPEDLAGHYDPHVWMDVSAWSHCVVAVAAALAEHDEAHKSDYLANAQALQQRFTELHEYGRKSIATIPEGSRVLVTSHDAFNYLGRAYGLEVQGVQGISTESEAGLQRVGELVDMLVEKNVQAVFIESSVPRKSIDSLIEGAKAKGHQVSVGGELFSDAMGTAGTYEGTYIGMLDHNITKIARGLGGQAPERGFNGKLSGDEKGASSE